MYCDILGGKAFDSDWHCLYMQILSLQTEVDITLHGQSPPFCIQGYMGENKVREKLLSGFTVLSINFEGEQISLCRFEVKRFR